MAWLGGKEVDPRSWIEKFTGRIVISLISMLPEKEQQQFFTEESRDRGYDVKVVVDGKELNFEKFALHVEQQMNRMIAEEAKTIIDGQVGELLMKLQFSLDDLTLGVRNKAAELLGYNPWQES